MKKIRYRCEAGSSIRAEARFHHVRRLGQITEIRGYRFRSTRGGRIEERFTATHERVLVKGLNGTARFDGVLWGYGGSGPHALRHLLLLCGVPEQVAIMIAHNVKRHEACGTDWTIRLGPPQIEHIECRVSGNETCDLTAPVCWPVRAA